MDNNLSAFDRSKTESTEDSTIEFPSYLSILEKMEQNDVSMPFLLAPSAIAQNKQRKKNQPRYNNKNEDLKIIKFSTDKSLIEVRPYQASYIIPKHPFRLILTGRSGSGKSNLLVNLMKKSIFYGRTDPNDEKSGYFDLVFLFSPTAGIGDDLVTHLDIPSQRIYTDPSTYLARLNHIFETQDALIKSGGIAKSPKILCIFDDIQSATKFMNSDAFTKLFIAGRHSNISIIVAIQSWTRLPRVLRLQASNIMLFPSSNSEVELLADEYTPPGVSKREFMSLVQHATREPYNFLHINNQAPDNKYRKNLDVVLSLTDNKLSSKYKSPD